VGYDEKWIDAGRQRSAVYTGLKGGDYRFEVIGTSSDRVESAQPAVLEFKKTKAFVETPVFVVLLLLAAAGLLWLGMQLRFRSIEARHQVMLAERQRIARELHDGLLQEFHGATLQLAALQLSNHGSVVGQQLDGVISGLEKSLQESRQAIQSLRGRQWDGVELYPALVECAEGLCLPAKVSVACQRSFHVTDLKADIKDAFWQIAREAIRNSLKHANPAQVQLELSSRDRELVMQIVDDGCGFRPEEARMRTSSRFGLAGLEERAKSVGGKLSIESAPGKGCRVTFQVTL
jgi:signal transduction histidine kinase